MATRAAKVRCLLKSDIYCSPEPHIWLRLLDEERGAVLEVDDMTGDKNLYIARPRERLLLLRRSWSQPYSLEYIGVEEIDVIEQIGRSRVELQFASRTPFCEHPEVFRR